MARRPSPRRRAAAAITAAQSAKAAAKVLCARRRRPLTCCRAGKQEAGAHDDEADADADDADADADADYGPLEELSEARHIIVEPDFTESAAELRAVFDARFEDPRATSRERFLWDYWHVEGQYSLIRTQAKAYFPRALYDRLEADLISYGERALGCRAISPVWMSYYVDGCVQELHCGEEWGERERGGALEGARGRRAPKREQREAEAVLSPALTQRCLRRGGGGGCSLTSDASLLAPRSHPTDSFHGPFAFVLSLTDWDNHNRAFTGGETVILKPETLDFWAGFVAGRGLEMGDLVTLVPPRFNQLTVRVTAAAVAAAAERRCFALCCLASWLGCSGREILTQTQPAHTHRLSPSHTHHMTSSSLTRACRTACAPCAARATPRRAASCCTAGSPSRRRLSTARSTPRRRPRRSTPRSTASSRSSR